MSVEEQLNELKEKEVQEKFQQWLEDGPYRPGSPEPSYELFKAGYLANETPSGNQYKGYLKEGNKTWEKIRPDEPIFILRAQDNTAPGVVMNWIEKNLDTVNEAKIKEALHTVLAMLRYDSRRDPT